jgi:DNA-binding response OmpR family regulator
MKILIVEDDSDTRDLFGPESIIAGYLPVLASDGKAGVEKANADKPELILMDMMMPVMDGLPAIQALVKLNPQVRIIAASGIPDNEGPAKAVGNQVRDFLVKPFSTEKLLRAVGQVLAS